MPKPDLKSLMPLPSALQMFTIAETAVILGVSRRLVSNWIQEGALPAIRLGPGQRLVRVNIGDLEAFIDQARKKGMTLRDFQEAYTTWLEQRQAVWSEHIAEPPGGQP